MATYHQMGHDSVNLLGEASLSGFAGAILSPINYNEEKLVKQVADNRKRDNFELIFDPQLYSAQLSRETLKEWSYFPKDIETADLSSFGWWEKVAGNLFTTLDKVSPHAMCSPAPIPRAYSLDYYDLMVSIGNLCRDKLAPKGIDVLQTVLVNVEALSEATSIMEIASVVSKTSSKRIYLIFVTDIEPRRELADEVVLKGAMKLIHHLKESGLKVTVGFTSTEMILWKKAGAESCATGKFFNLRRFTKSRFNEPEGGGGGQLPYWVEESLVAFLRQADVLRLHKAGRIKLDEPSNPVSADIEKCMSASAPWLALAWRHYMWWFCDFERRMSANPEMAEPLLEKAEKKWLELEDSKLHLMEEPRNTGAWLRPWRQACLGYLK